MAKKKDLKEMVDEQLKTMMEATEEPSEGRMKLLGIAIKKLALDARLDENQFGDFFDDTDADPRNTKRTEAKPATDKRANGGPEST